MWREPAEHLEPTSEAVGIVEVGEMAAELIVAVVVVALDVPATIDPLDQSLSASTVLDRAVYALDLAATQKNGPPDRFLIFAVPRMFGFGQPRFDPVGLADHVEPHRP